jgi:hypothetical protein
MGRGTSDILCHLSDIFRHHQNPDLPRRVGLRTTAKESPWLDCGISPFGDRLLLNRIGGPCPVRSASERARHATNTSSRTRGAHPSANDIRANQHSVCFSRKATRSGLAPRRVGLCTTAKEHLARPWHFPLWPPPLAGPPGWACSSRPHKWASASDRQMFADARSASLRKVGLWLVSELSPLGKMGLDWRLLGGSGSARPPRKALAPPRHLPLWPPAVAQPYRRTLPGTIRKRMASASDRQMFADARSASFPNSAFGLSPSCPREATRIRCAPLGGSGSARPPRKALGSTAAFRLWQPPLAQPHRMVILRTTAIQGPAAFIDALPSASYPCSIHCG